MKIKDLYNKSMKYKLSVAALLPIIIIVLFISYYYPAQQKKLIVESANSQVKTLSEMLAFSVGAGLKEANFDLVQTAFNWAKKDKNVIYIEILDETNTSIINFNPNNISVNTNTTVELKEENNTLRNDCAINYQDKNYGKVVIVYSLNEYQNQIDNNLYISLLIGLGILIIGFVITHIFVKPIIQQITTLVNAAEKIGEGDTSVRIEKTSQDEIGKLGEAFNKMSENLAAINKELAEEKQSIEKKVEEAIFESEKQREYLRKSVDKLLNEMNKFSEGDLTVGLEIESEDEIGLLFSGFNKAVNNIKEMLLLIKEAIDKTANASSQISLSSEEIAAGAMEQSMQTSEVATAVDAMSRTIFENAKNTSYAAAAAKESGDKAIQGGSVVEQSIDGMNKVAMVVQKSADTIFTLGRNSDKIGDIVQVINDIADQTNLLALNAAIEAARAGEQGRGFAVVADEVRKLAERTSKATKEIAIMIKQIQTDTSNAVDSIRQGTEEVEKGKEKAVLAGSVLNEIVDKAKKVSDLINQVATAGEEQSATVEQISKNIEAINNVSRESSDGIQQIAHAADDLNNLTSELQNLFSKFKLDNSHGLTKRK